MTSNKMLVLLLALIFLVFALFAISPELDLAVTGAFYDGSTFPWKTAAPITQAIRNVLWDATLVMPLAALLMIVAGVALRRTLLVPNRIWGYVLALFLLGPGLVVNAVFKEHWGRARPFMVTEFGGEARFTPPWQITDQCAHNCSFVSGEGAGIMAFAISLLLILFALRDRISVAVYRMCQTVVVAMVAFIGAQRVMSGDHFLSDVLLSWLFTALIALVLARLVLRPTGTGPRP